MKSINWIEKAFGKKLLWNPVRIGIRFGRELYTVVFEDHTECDCFIDYEKKIIEIY